MSAIKETQGCCYWGVDDSEPSCRWRDWGHARRTRVGPGTGWDWGGMTLDSFAGSGGNWTLQKFQVERAAWIRMWRQQMTRNLIVTDWNEGWSPSVYVPSHGSRCWGSRSKQNRQSPCSHSSCILGAGGTENEAITYQVITYHIAIAITRWCETPERKLKQDKEAVLF